MQEDRPRTGIVSVSGKQTRNQTPRTTLCHTPPCFPIPHFASNSPFRRRSSVCGQLSADHVAPSRQSESHYADSRSPGATACQLAAKERSEQCLAFFGHTATGSPAGRKNSNGTRSCAPTSAHCSSLKFMPHKTGLLYILIRTFRTQTQLIITGIDISRIHQQVLRLHHLLDSVRVDT